MGCTEPASDTGLDRLSEEAALESEPGPVRVVLVDDEELIRAGLALLLAAEPGIEVVGEAGDGKTGIETAIAARPDVVVMDLRMPGMDGTEATRTLTTEAFPAEHGEPPAVLVLTTFSDDDQVSLALRAGAAGFLLKNSAPQTLASAIRALARGEGWLDPAVTRGHLRQFSQGHHDPPRPMERGPAAGDLGRLSAREQEVLASMAAGMKNSEIAEHLFLSEATVKSHVHRILTKLCLTDRSQAVALAFRDGLVKPRRR